MKMSNEWTIGFVILKLDSKSESLIKWILFEDR